MSCAYSVSVGTGTAIQVPVLVTVTGTKKMDPNDAGTCFGYYL